MPEVSQTIQLEPGCGTDVLPLLWRVGDSDYREENRGRERAYQSREKEIINESLIRLYNGFVEDSHKTEKS